MVAWMSVVLFQAIVHFGLIGPRRRHSTSLALEGSMNDDDETSNLSSDDCRLAATVDDDDDEPEEYHLLLSQTRCERFNVSQ
jgi:hypothetical protein